MGRRDPCEGMTHLLDLLERQGFVTTRDAARLGVSPVALHQLTASGRLRRAAHSVYLSPDKGTPESELSLLARAVLSTDPFAVASHQSALALHGLPCHRVPTTLVHVADARKSSRIHACVHRHVLRPGDRVVDADGWRALSPGLTATQVAARYGVHSGLVAMDAALRLQLTTAGELGHLIDSGRIRRGLVAARKAVALADGRAESPGESLLRLVLADTPWSLVPQAAIGPYRVDLLVDNVVVAEFDGETKYANAHGPAALAQEKQREDWLRRNQYEVARFVWANLNYPATIRQTIHEAVVRGRARRAA